MEVGYPMLTVKDMRDYGFDYSSCKRISNSDFDKMVKNDCIPQKDDVLIAKDGSYLKHVFTVQESREEAVLSSIAIFRPDKDIITSKYLKYFIINPVTKKLITDNFVSGSAIPRIVLKDFKKIKIKIPSLSEQKAITHILSVLDEKIDINNKINIKLEEIAQAIFRRWFVDFEFPNEEGEPFRSSGGEMVESELGLIPKGWRVTTIRDLTDVVSKGTTPTRHDIDNANDISTVKFLKVKDISGDGEIDLVNLEMIPKSVHLKQLKRSILKYKDILVSIAGTIGRVSFVNSELDGSNTNQAVSFTRLIDPEKHFLLLFYKFKSSEFQDSIKSKIVQGVQANISLTVIKNEKLILPNDDVLHHYNKTLNNIFDLRNITFKEVDSLKIMRDTLLPLLMTGEIRVTIISIFSFTSFSLNRFLSI